MLIFTSENYDIAKKTKIVWRKHKKQVWCFGRES